MVAVLDAGDVDVDNVARLENLFVARDPVANHVIDRNAGGGGVGRHARRAVAETSGNAALNVDGVVVSKTIEFARGNAGFDERREVVEKFGGKAAGNPQTGNVFGRFNGNGHDWKANSGIRRQTIEAAVWAAEKMNVSAVRCSLSERGGRLMIYVDQRCRRRLKPAAAASMFAILLRSRYFSAKLRRSSSMPQHILIDAF